jgi:hypothetical protein
MAYGFVQDVPANAEIYGLIKEKLGDVTPAGLVAHVVIEREGGLRYVDVWETEAAWNTFRDERVEPVVAEVLAGLGIPHDHSIVVTNEVTIVDAWLGHSVSA